MAEHTEVADTSVEGVYPFEVFTRDALMQNPLVLDQELLDDYADIDAETGRVEAYQRYRDWYAGNHSVDLSGDERALLEAATGITWSDNFLPVIVKAYSQRMKLESFSVTVDGDAPDDDTIPNNVNRVHVLSRLDKVIKRANHSALKLGDAFIIYDFDDAENRIVAHVNQPDRVRVQYDDENHDTMLWASKVWVTNATDEFNPNGDDVTRMNVYHPDRIEKYVNGSGQWRPYMDDADELWPVPWIDEDENEPLGIPVIHIRNDPDDNEDNPGYGVSEIHNLISDQALLNEMVIDLFRVVRLHGGPGRWGTGIQQDEADEMVAGADTLWSAQDDKARFGQFDPANPTGILEAIKNRLQHMSGKSRVPIYTIMSAGAMPSGESLKMGDSGLSDAVEDKTVYYGNAWEDFMIGAVNLQHVRGTEIVSLPITPDIHIESMWQDVKPRNEKELAESLRIAVESFGLPMRVALEKWGEANAANLLDEWMQERETLQEMQRRMMTRGFDFE